MEALFQAKIKQEQRALQVKEALACSNATITELKTHISQLENELKKHLEESSNTLATIKELKAQIQNLKEEQRNRQKDSKLIWRLFLVPDWNKSNE